jgi:hypothetical protein
MELPQIENQLPSINNRQVAGDAVGCQGLIAFGRAPKEKYIIAEQRDK